MSHLFAFSDRKDFSGIEKWDVSNVLSTNSMFYGAEYFNQNISNWNVDKVEDSRNMFMCASSFNQPIDNFKNIIFADHMFENALSFNQDISGWKPKKMLSGKSLFKNAVSFDQDIDSFLRLNFNGNGICAFENSPAGIEIEKSVQASNSFGQKGRYQVRDKIQNPTFISMASTAFATIGLIGASIAAVSFAPPLSAPLLFSAIATGSSGLAVSGLTKLYDKFIKKPKEALRIKKMTGFTDIIPSSKINMSLHEMSRNLEREVNKQKYSLDNEKEQRNFNPEHEVRNKAYATTEHERNKQEKPVFRFNLNAPVAEEKINSFLAQAKQAECEKNMNKEEKALELKEQRENYYTEEHHPKKRRMQ